MNREKLMEAVKRHMPERRWQHTLGVMESAAELAKRFGADPSKADVAAVLHDTCKYWPVGKQAEAVKNSGAQLDLLEYDKELWHAQAGAFVAERDFGIQDREVLDAIRYHTSGRENMTLLDKVLWLADYIEPGRDFPGVGEVRQLAEADLNQALIAAFDNTIRFLLQHGKRIYPLTVLARNSLIMEIRQEK